MQGHSDNVTKGSQKLLRCTIVNKESQKSDRFVEVENYRLWAYMMLHKHGMVVKASSLWLWLEESHYLEKERLYSVAPEILEVSKIGVFLFDENHGYNHASFRYVTVDQVSKMKEILLSHISPELKSTGNCEVIVEKGFCIKSVCKDPEKLVLGLSNDTKLV